MTDFKPGDRVVLKRANYSYHISHGVVLDDSHRRLDAPEWAIPVRWTRRSGGVDPGVAHPNPGDLALAPPNTASLSEVLAWLA